MQSDIGDDASCALKSAALLAVSKVLLDEFHEAHVACFRIKITPVRTRIPAKQQEAAHREALLTKDATYAYLYLYNALAQILTKEGLETPSLEKAPHHYQPRDKGTAIVESIMEDCLSTAHTAAKSKPDRGAGRS